MNQEQVRAAGLQNQQLCCINALQLSRTTCLVPEGAKYPFLTAASTMVFAIAPTARMKRKHDITTYNNLF